MSAQVAERRAAAADVHNTLNRLTQGGIGATNQTTVSAARILTVTAANSWTYGYDGLDRITGGVKTGTTRGWSYDANGNRLAETGSAASTYTIAGSSNRIASTTGALARTYTYDAAGNTLTYSNVIATYNNRGRMKTLKVGTTNATYVYNALGQRVKRSGGTSGTVLS